jgi:acyl-ACP thioesterase
MHLTIAGLVNYFQDTSTFHTESLEVNMSYLKTNALAWVLTYWHVVVDSYPRLGEEVSISTWPYEFAGFSAKRNFVMKDREGKVIAHANTMWVLVDLKKGRIKKIDDKQIELYTLSPPYPMIAMNRKVEAEGEVRSRESFRVQASDIDSNGHVNNGKYIQMAMAYLPEKEHVRELRVEYLTEAKLGDVIHPSLAIAGNKSCVILASEGKKPYAVVEFQ